MKKTLVAIGIAGLLSGCGMFGGHHAGGGHHKAHWGYHGDAGPEHWAELSEDYGLCGTGKAQSPINIEGEQAGDLKPIEFHYQAASNPTVVNNGHTIQVNYPAGSYAVIGGKRYELLQFHFHSPSEHTVHGQHADMVAHLVHKADDGQLAVVGILFDKGAENPTLKPVFDAMPKSKGETTVQASINAADLLPEERGYYHYTGSLTTPPCSEGVNWNVMKAHMPVSEQQVQAFTHIFDKSIRPVQPLNGRTITEL